MIESKTDRSRVMRAVKSKDTAPEIIVRKLVYGLGYRYRLYKTDLPGKPDLVFVKKKKIIFVHGCFWHGHICKRGNRQPSSNKLYWIEKIRKNKTRDDNSVSVLSKAGWSILIVWECELKNMELIREKVLSFLMTE